MNIPKIRLFMELAREASHLRWRQERFGSTTDLLITEAEYNAYPSLRATFPRWAGCELKIAEDANHTDDLVSRP